MDGSAPFEPATPAMIVGTSLDGSPPPLGLGEPLALLGGDRLGPEAIPFHFMHEHQPALRQWVAQSCESMIAAGQPWFKGKPLLSIGDAGRGSWHATRWLSQIAGVPRVSLDLTDRLIARAVSASKRTDERLWACPHTVAMAAWRCANPVVRVEGVDQASDDVVQGLVEMIDPDTSRAWCEDQLNISMDLGEITWSVETKDPTRLPTTLRNLLTPVVLNQLPRRPESVAILSILLEAMNDCGIAHDDPDFSWTRVWQASPRAYGIDADEIYAELVSVLMQLRRASCGDEATRSLPF